MSLPPVPLNWHAPFTYGHLAEYGRACRAAALEEALGKAMEWTEAARKDSREYGVGMDIAAAIRALKDA